jgi:hypothetical protein
VGESISDRSVVVVSQYASWLFGQLLRLRYSIGGHFPAGLFERNRGHCLILVANHRTYVDLGLLMIALGYRRFRFLVPVRTLGTQDFRSPVLQWLRPLITSADAASCLGCCSCPDLSLDI